MSTSDLTMKAVLCEEYGDIEKLSVANIQVPELKQGHVRIQVEASGVNFPDALLVQGKYQMQPDLPFVPGTEVAGTLIEIGENVPSHLSVGMPVIAVTQLGGFAEQLVVPGYQVMPRPDAISAEEGAALTTAYATAHHALKQRANLQSDEWLLVTGASGGTGLAAVQIGKAMGAKVIAVVSSEEKAELASQYGADETLNYDEEAFKPAIKEITGGKGIDVVYECVGGDVFEWCARSMAWQGRLLVVGFAGGTIPKVAMNLPLVKGFDIVGVFWGQFIQRDPKGFAANMMELFGWLQSGQVKVHLGESFAMEDVGKALNKLLNREAKGKFVLTL